MKFSGLKKKKELYEIYQCKYVILVMINLEGGEHSLKSLAS